MRTRGYNLPGPVRHVTGRVSRDDNGLTAVARDTLMRLATDGVTYAEMALTLGIPREAMKSRVSQLFKSLGVSNRADAVARGQQLGLISAPEGTS